MNKKLFQSGKSLLSKLCLTSLLLIGMGNTAWADELTINESTTTSFYVPFYSSALATGNGSGQFIIPATSLTDLKDSNISSITFEVAAGSTFNGAEHKVYLKEVDKTVFSSATYDDWNEMTEVFSGALSIMNSKVVVEFSSDYTYAGGNLLIGFQQTKNATAAPSPAIKWNGVNASGNTAVGYKYSSIGNTSFLPQITFTYSSGEATTSKLSVSTSTIDFGSLHASDTQTVTVTNTGVGSMDVTIVNDNSTDFTVSTTSLTGIGAGESKTFDVTFNYDAANLGDKTASITVTPSYDAADAKTIAVTATAADAAVWEDFDDGIPSTWYNEDGYWLNYVSGLSGYASPGYNSDYILRTPRLYAEEGEALGFDVKIVGKYSSNVVTASYSTDRANWSSPVTYSADGTYSITAPATGYYWVKFTASQAGIDNMTGWALAPVSHETVLGTATIPSTGTVHGDYTAKVDVMELGGSEENITAELYFGETKVTEETMTISGNRDVTVTLTYLPTEPFSGNVYIKVSGENIGTLETDPVAVSITETEYVFDENSDVNPVISSSSVVKVIYTARKGWNTICMPFSLSSSPAYMNTIFGEGWTAYAINSYDNGHLTFKSTTYMATTTPFLVYAPNAESHPDGVYLQNVSAGSYNWSHTNINQTVGDATFKGTFAPIDAPGMEGKYGVTPKGQIMNGNSSANIKAYHAYFELATAPAKLTIEIDENDAPTLIGAVQMMEDNAAIYDMMGRKVETLNGKVVSGQLPKGIYIVNGKKVIVK